MMTGNPKLKNELAKGKEKERTLNFKKFSYPYPLINFGSN